MIKYIVLYRSLTDFNIYSKEFISFDEAYQFYLSLNNIQYRTLQCKYSCFTSTYFYEWCLRNEGDLIE